MKHFCVLPFQHITIRPDGTFNPCSRYRMSSKQRKEQKALMVDTLNVDMNAVDHVRNSFEWIDLKESLSQNKPMLGCQKCYDQDSNDSKGIDSLRVIKNNKFGHEKFSDKLDIYDNPLRSLEVSFSNKCELQCLHCNSQFSSSWFDLDKELVEHGFDDRQISDTPELGIPSNFFDNADLSKLEILRINGGEPIGDPLTLPFFRKLNEQGTLKNLEEMRFLTNGMNFPDDELLGYFKKITGKVVIYIGVDGYKESYEKMRYPAKWSMLEHNLERYVDFAQKTGIRIYMNTTINSVTFRDLPNTMLWWLKKTEFLPPRNKNIVPVQVTGPEYLSLKAVPEWERDAVANRIKDIVIPQYIDGNWTQNSLDKKINKLVRFLEQPQKYNPELKDKLETFVNVINNTK